MTLGERIKKARRSLDLTQQKFADQIGTTQNNIASYEIGRREPSAAAINNICKTFSISEEWLRTGTGEMFASKGEDDLSALFAELGATELEQQIVRAFLCIDERIRVPLMRQLLQKVQTAVPQEDASRTDPAPAVQALAPVDTGGQERTDEDIEREVEDFRRRLVLEKKQAGEPSPSSADDATA